MVDYLFMHIEKTGGSSFRKTIQKIYGNEKAIQRNQISKFSPKYRKKFMEISGKLTDKVKIISGHFNYWDLINYYKLDENIPILTWIRNPVDRVISHYFFHKRKHYEDIKYVINKKKISKNEKRRIYRLELSLLDFAQKRANVNRMNKFVKGISMDKFAFVGIFENYSADLKLFGSKMGWQGYSEHNEKNFDKSDRDIITKSERKKIEKINREDIELYNHMVNLRKEGKLFRI